MELIGRHAELEKLEEATTSKMATMVALTGRRRVGKTYLIRQYFEENIDLEIVGSRDQSTEIQLRNFSFTLEKSGSVDFGSAPKDWTEAFQRLTLFLEQKAKQKQRLIVFFDEFPWLATHRSGFLDAFTYFWNSSGSKLPLTMVICGSAASWMLKNVVNNKGGLHNRITHHLNIKPFSLAETKQFLEYKEVYLDYYQILILYMVFGGVPYYLDKIKKGKSAAENIDILCFGKQAELRNEFKNLYRSLFVQPERYEEAVRVLNQKKSGMTRLELVDKMSLNDGGGITTILSNLEETGFIHSYYPFGKKKKDTLFRLTDAYSLFYLKFIENSRPTSSSYWMKKSQTQAWKSWSGYAFENTCLIHISKIEDKLGISGIHTEAGTFYAKGTQKEPGVQIDLLIDRADQTLNLCEMKFYNEPIRLDKKRANDLKTKREIFKTLSKTKRHVFLTLISPHGIISNENSLGLVDNWITAEDLF